MKLLVAGAAGGEGRSPPARGRGLKLRADKVDQGQRGSPPARGRGLKLWMVHEKTR